ncbi:glycosyltransferase [Candidatus Woesebacteria bacterium]|nr:glycosyltransferase [Candidatus Woesebacteria bacterium]MCD8507520.1 glycosyltransferase [Candidatus Woesebacteria bacterium]MCD8527359.1 glycosyltransferase [Candidatus Woesebacteria bacterium]MCD8546106.1 glycosyltransferase [Candidatus Woesebacteria bacterium]
MSSGEKAIIIIPTYNEKPNITKLLPLIDKVRKKITEWELEVLVVDDSSPDGTAEAVEGLQKKYPYLHLLINKQKSGLGGAYLKGMAHAFGKLKADVVFEMDADLSHDPKKIPEFLAALDAGADMVLGSRYIPGGSIPSNWGWHRKFLSVAGNNTISLIMWSRAVKDWTGGYRAIRKKVYQKVHRELEESARFTGYTFQIGFLLKAIRAGFTISEVPFHFVDREVGESKLGTEYIINTLRYIVTTRLQEIFAMRLVKFVMVGGLGFVVNTVFFNLFKFASLWTTLSTALGIPAQHGLLEAVLSDQALAVILSAELAILSNYILNNFWTFQDRQIHGVFQHLNKFVQFNIGSMGSIVIQYIVMQASLRLFGIFTLLTVFGVPIASDNLYLAAGVLIGMVWNFSIYSLVIWRKK